MCYSQVGVPSIDHNRSSDPAACRYDHVELLPPVYPDSRVMDRAVDRQELQTALPGAVLGFDRMGMRDGMCIIPTYARKSFPTRALS